MITQRFIKAIAARRAADAEFDAALLECLDYKPVATPAAGRPTTAKPAATARKPLPPPVLEATNGPKDLSDETRAENLPDAITVARDVIRAVGAESPMLLPGVRGQLANKHIPYDDKLIAQAIEAAKRG